MAWPSLCKKVIKKPTNYFDDLIEQSKIKKRQRKEEKVSRQNQRHIDFDT